MNLIEIENASRHSWPALSEEELPCGVLRFSRGVSRRANSFNPFPGSTLEPELLLAQIERFFRDHQLPAIVRIIESHSAATAGFAAMDACLEAQQYAVMTPTSVMTLALQDHRVPRDTACNLPVPDVDLSTWLEAWYALTEKSGDELPIHHDMLARLQYPHRLLAQPEATDVWLNCGMAVVCGKLLGIFGIATAQPVRGQGLATNLVTQLLEWGASQGCDTAYLQVECANAPALGVYARLGFTEAYRYWYREKRLDQ